MKNLYEILEVEKNASQEEIKKNYRKLALENHPDRGGSEEKIKEINAAYSILGDEQKRQQYDLTGSTSNQTQQHQQHNPFAGFGINIEDLFEFGNNYRNVKSVKGKDLLQTITISFAESILGCTKNVSVSYLESCGFCIGSGAKDGKDRAACQTCKGSGKTMQFSGIISIMHSCSDCSGRGYKIINKCSHCNGTGNKDKNNTYSVTIPPGIDNNTNLRLNGKGMPAEYGGSFGDLYLNVIVGRDTRFQKEGINIISDLKIDYLDALLGREVECDTVHGKTKIKIPPLTQNDSMLISSGFGVHKNNQKGDHLFKIKITIPKKLSEEEKNKLEEIKRGRV